VKTYAPALPRLFGALALSGLLAAVFAVADVPSAVSLGQSGALVPQFVTLRPGSFEPRLSAGDALRIGRDFARTQMHVSNANSLPVLMSQGLFTGQPDIEGAAFATDLPVRVVVIHDVPRRPRGTKLSGATYSMRFTMLISDQTGEVVYSHLGGTITRPTPIASTPAPPKAAP